jgi:hypothetical protein
MTIGQIPIEWIGYGFLLWMLGRFLQGWFEFKKQHRKYEEELKRRNEWLAREEAEQAKRYPPEWRIENQVIGAARRAARTDRAKLDD